MQERREENKAAGEGKEYLSEGEDRRPSFKWGRMKAIGRKKKKKEENRRNVQIRRGKKRIEDGRPCIKWRRQQTTNTT